MAIDLVEEMSQTLGPKDELWLCRSVDYQPDALIGEEGLAVVRAGVIVAYRPVKQH
ncbi:hypothetical protein [Devosia limi]|uniref:hypothetical protein n=1 Tax=Devosia limi TaxID=288995 RepID=UPI000B113553|nr:hypothetical protein [Devosia limi]